MIQHVAWQIVEKDAKTFHEFIYTLGEKIVAKVAVHDFEKDIPNICNLFVLPEYQRKGIATELIKECLKFCEHKKSVNLYVYKDNYAALCLYYKFGFFIHYNETDGFLYLTKLLGVSNDNV